jgi:6-phosphogluconolactonase (cycloisomerase 2 family)
LDQYVGGSILFFPVESDGSLSSTSNSPPLKFPFPYEGKKKPNEERQDASHPHQVYEAANGTLYVPDLGSDRIWVVEREGAEGLAIKGYLQAPEGSGPRHCQISDDGGSTSNTLELIADLVRKTPLRLDRVVQLDLHLLLGKSNLPYPPPS